MLTVHLLNPSVNLSHRAIHLPRISQLQCTESNYLSATLMMMLDKRNDIWHVKNAAPTIRLSSD